MRQRGILLALLFITTPLWAYRGRPASDLRFDGRDSVYQPRLASDGTDFLALVRTGHLPTGRVFTQKIAGGSPVGPQHEIGTGEPTGLVWTGSDYLASSMRGKELWVTRVSRDGSVRATPSAPVLTADLGFIAGDGDSVLAFGYTEYDFIVQRLDRDGQPLGLSFRHSAPVRRANITVAPVDTGFAVVFSGYQGTWVMRLRDDGSAFPPILLDGPYGGTTTDYHSNTAAVASDGTDTVIVFGAGRYEHEAQLRSVTLDANGVVKRSGVILQIDGRGDRGISPVGLAWNGTQYIAMLNIDRSQTPAETTGVASLLRLTRSGEPDGELQWVEEQPASRATAFSSNARSLAVTLSDFNFAPFVSAIDVATLRASTPARLGRTVATQRAFTVDAGHEGYLAAWFEWRQAALTVRASRVDRSGNYLDGEGIVLDTFPPGFPTFDVRNRIAIAGGGPQWLVVWAAGSIAKGRVIAPNGTPAAASAFTLGAGREAAARWDGTSYVVLRAERSLYRDVVTASGNVLETQLLLESHDDPANGEFVQYAEPSLVMLRDRMLAVFVRDVSRCSPPGGDCSHRVDVLGLRLDTADAQPFEIAPNIFGNISTAVASDSAMVMWDQGDAVYQTILSAAAPEQPAAPRLVDARSGSPRVAFDGNDFIATWVQWKYPQPAQIATTRITRDGMAGPTSLMRLDDAETVDAPVIAAAPQLPALAGWLDQHPAYDDAPRAMLLFTSEIDEDDAAPFAPSILCATTNDDETITVRWNPIQDALGISIELQLPDGTFRQIGVAPGGAGFARVPLAGFARGAVRVRAWNAAGLSAPSFAAPAIPPPSAILRSTVSACSGVPVTIAVTLRGIAPFTVRWSDGVVQSNITTSSTSRSVTSTYDRTLKIVSVADGSCATNEVAESVRIHVDPMPTVSLADAEIKIARGATATLVATATNADAYAWYEGAPGDTSRQVGAAPAFTTPALNQSTRYWVRVSNRCGDADSPSLLVTVPPSKSRAARH